MNDFNVTRGYGLLEGFLARQRIKITNGLLKSCSSKDRILDIGCGTYPLFLLQSNFFEKYGIDKVSYSREIEQLKNSNIIISNHDIVTEEKLPFENSNFDAVTMLAVFEHIEPTNLAEVLNEIHRVLRPEGIFIITTPAKWTDGLLRIMSKLKLVSSVEIGEHKEAYTAAKISALLRSAGFDKEKIQFGYFEMFMNIWTAAKK
jgi:ubiquinone/menaquinone biosynthesis C-methylase UbiE